jgi:hypothetical protein
MRSLLVYAISACVFLLSCTLLADQSGPGNGTDYVKVLFAQAQYDVTLALAPIDDAAVPSLGLSPEVAGWLLGQSQGASRLSRVKYWLRRMDLRFQNEPCPGGPTICFYNEPNDPYVLISLDGNRMTTQTQAMAMLVHEAGHFAGEMDHLLLDRVGVALVAVAKTPSSLFADASSTEIVPNPFQAKADCDAGTGTQALALRDEVRLKLLRQCSDRGFRCDESRIQ